MQREVVQQPQYSAPVQNEYVSVLEPRPHTIPSTQVAMIEVTKEQLSLMTVEEILRFAWEYLGVALDATQERNKLLTTILKMATEIE